MGRIRWATHLYCTSVCVHMHCICELCIMMHREYASTWHISHVGTYMYPVVFQNTVLYALRANPLHHTQHYTYVGTYVRIMLTRLLAKYI